MKIQDSCRKTKVAWAVHEAVYAPGLVAKVRHALPPDMPEGGLAYLLEAFEAPSRPTDSTTRSSGARYPSPKMGVTLGVDSSTIELPAAMKLERDAEVIAYLNQAPALRLSYKSNGRTRSHYHRPDFLAVYADRMVLIECKREAAMRDKNEKAPGFFVLGDDGRWRCPAGESAAALLGMTYVIWSDADFSQLMIRNLRLLNDFVTPERRPEVRSPQDIQDYLASRGRATISAVLEDLEGEVCIDDVYSAIARNEIAFDLNSVQLTSRENCWVYRDTDTMAAFSAIPSSDDGVEIDVKGAAAVCLREGDDVMWQGNRWKCLAVNVGRITFSRDAHLHTMEMPLFLKLVRAGEMSLVGLDTQDSPYVKAAKIIGMTSPEALAVARKRLERIKPVLDGVAPAPQERSMRRYISNYRAADLAYGPGFGLIGLIPKTDSSGNRTSRLPEEVLRMSREFIEKSYLDPANRNRKAVYLLLNGACTTKGFAPPSYSWFAKQIKNLPTFSTELARKGRKGAYKYEPRALIDGRTTADYAWAAAHVDHTPIDLATLFGIDGLETTRPWLTTMICVYTRRVLAFSLSYDPPSNRSVCHILRECVRRHHRLPEKLILDGGKEFGSKWTETTCAIYRVIIQRRPIAKPRGGSEGERMFGTVTTQLFNFLTGNTQLTKNVRSMSQEVSPFKRAVWTADRLKSELFEYFYEVYDQTRHVSLLCSPREKFDESLKEIGQRQHRFIPFDELFLILTSGTTDKGTAKVQPDGVKINYLYYNAVELASHLGESVQVRFDQFDLSIAWAFVGSRWVKLMSRHASLLTRFSERDVGVISETWRLQRANSERSSLSPATMIRFLERLVAKEADQLSRRLALEERALRAKDVNAADSLGAEHDETDEVSEDSDLPPITPSPAVNSLQVSTYRTVRSLQ